MKAFISQLWTFLAFLLAFTLEPRHFSKSCLMLTGMFEKEEEEEVMGEKLLNNSSIGQSKQIVFFCTLNYIEFQRQ